jgi:SAM-dependent methyltransferase
MERIIGKRCQEITTGELDALVMRLAALRDVHVDLGTGDGRFVLDTARAHPLHSVIGIDACRDNLREASRRAPANALFLIANALDLPAEFAGLASAITINFPWGTLLTGLLDERAPLWATLSRLARPHATLAIRLNGGAMAEAGWPLEAGAEQARRLAGRAGFRLAAPHTLAADDLRALPSTWARRLAFGRDPRALALVGRSQSAYHRTDEEKGRIQWPAHSR